MDAPLKMRFKKYAQDVAKVEDIDSIEKDLQIARNQSEKLMIFQIGYFQKTVLSKVNDKKFNTKLDTKILYYNKEDYVELNDTPRETTYHIGYFLKYIKNTHYLRYQFIENLKEKAIIYHFQLWEEIDDLYNAILNDIFITEKQAFHAFQRIKQNFKNIL